MAGFTPDFHDSEIFGKQGFHLDGNANELKRGQVRVKIGNRELDVIEIRVDGKLKNIGSDKLEALAVEVYRIYSESRPDLKALMTKSNVGFVKKQTLDYVLATLDNSGSARKVEIGKDTFTKGGMLDSATRVYQLLENIPGSPTSVTKRPESPPFSANKSSPNSSDRRATRAAAQRASASGEQLALHRKLDNVCDDIQRVTDLIREKTALLQQNRAALAEVKHLKATLDELYSELRYLNLEKGRLAESVSNLTRPPLDKFVTSVVQENYLGLERDLLDLQMYKQKVEDKGYSPDDWGLTNKVLKAFSLEAGGLSSLTEQYQNKIENLRWQMTDPKDKIRLFNAESKIFEQFIDLNDGISKLRNEISSLRNGSSAFRETLMQNEIEYLRDDLEALNLTNGSVKALTEQVQELEDALNHLQTESAGSQEKYSEEILQLKETIKELRMTLRKSQGERDEMSSNLNTRVDLLASDMGVNLDGAEDLQNKITLIKGKFEEREKLRAALEKQLSQSQDRYKQLEAQNSLLMTKSDSLEGVVSQIKVLLEDSNTPDENLFEGVNQIISGLTRRAESAESKLSEQEHVVEARNEELAQKQKALQDLEVEIATLKIRLKEGGQSKGAVEEDLKTLTQEHSELKRECEGLRKENTATQAIIDSLNEQLTLLNQTKTSLEEKEADRERVIAALNTSRDSLQRVLDKFAVKGDSPEALSKALTSKLEKAQQDESNLADAKGKLAASEEMLTQLRSELSEKEKAIVNLGEEIELRDKDIGTQKQTIGAKSQNVKELSGELKKQQKKLAELKAQLDKAETENAGLKRNLDKLTSDLDSHRDTLRTIYGILDEKELEANLSVTDLLGVIENQTKSLIRAVENQNSELNKQKVELNQLNGRISALRTTNEQQAATIQEQAAKVQEVTSNLFTAEERIKELTSQVDRLQRSTNLSVPLTVNVGDATYPTQKEIARLRELLEAVKNDRSSETVDLDKGDPSKDLIEALNGSLWISGSVESLINTNASSLDMLVLSQIISELVAYPKPEERKELILNLMLVVSNYSPEILRARAPNSLEFLKSLKITAANSPGYKVAVALSEHDVINDELMQYFFTSRGKTILKPSLDVIESLNQALKTAHEISDSKRVKIKESVEQTIATYLSSMGFSLDPKNVSSFVGYVKKSGNFPPAIKLFLEKDNTGEHLEALSKLIFLHTVGDSKLIKRFKDIGALPDFLTSGKSNQDRARIILKYVKKAEEEKSSAGSTNVALTREQMRWGERVKKSMDGDEADPINAPGGAGKTVTVQRFMKIISEISESESPIVFVSPIPQSEIDASGKIINKMLLIPESGSDVFIDMGDMSVSDMKTAKVAIDECHIIRPEMRVCLRNNTGEKVYVDNYLQLTASPLSAGYNLITTTKTSLESIEAEIQRLQTISSSILTGDLEKRKTLKRIEDLFFSNDLCKQIAGCHAPVSGYASKALDLYNDLTNKTFPIQEWNGKYNSFKDQMGMVIGGEATSLKSTGALGGHSSFDAVIKLFGPEIIPKLELIALELFSDDPKLGVEKYLTWTTGSIDSNNKITPLPLTEAQKSTRQGEREAAALKVKNDPKIALASKLRKQIESLRVMRDTLKDKLIQYEEESKASIYKITKQRREKALISIQTKRSDLLGLNSRAFGMINESCADFGKKKLQLVFPGVRFDDQSKLESLVIGLSGDKDRVFVYRSLVPGDTFGKNCCMKIEGGTLKTTVLDSNSEITLESLHQGSHGQVIMLYDNQTKQGGDFGVLSETTAEKPIKQLVFANISESGANPIEKLSGGDTYQSICRKRGAPDPDPEAATIFVSINPDLITKETLEDIPTEQLVDFLKNVLKDKDDSLILKLVDIHAKSNAKSKLIDIYLDLQKAGRLSLSDDDAVKISFISKVEKRQREIEAFEQKRKAVAHIANRILNLSSGSLPRDLQSEIADVHTSLIDKNVHHLLLNEKNTDLDAKLSRIQDLAGRVQEVYVGIKTGSETSLSHLIGRDINPSSSIESSGLDLYVSAISALNTIREIETYSQQAYGNLVSPESEISTPKHSKHSTIHNVRTAAFPDESSERSEVLGTARPSTARRGTQKEGSEVISPIKVASRAAAMSKGVVNKRYV